LSGRLHLWNVEIQADFEKGGNILGNCSTNKNKEKTLENNQVSLSGRLHLWNAEIQGDSEIGGNILGSCSTNKNKEKLWKTTKFHCQVVFIYGMLKYRVIMK
jgi:hypothetical protein